MIASAPPVRAEPKLRSGDCPTERPVATQRAREQAPLAPRRSQLGRCGKRVLTFPQQAVCLRPPAYRLGGATPRQSPPAALGEPSGRAAEKHPNDQRREE